MPFPSVTYTFTNGNTADATQVNQDFTDIINGISDGTKSLNMSAGTFAGTLTANAAVTLGASAGNAITWNGSLNSSIPMVTTNTNDIAGSTIGLRSIYLADSGSNARTTRVIGAAIASSWTMTLPTSGGSSGQHLQTDGAGVTSWVQPSATPKWAQSVLVTSVSAGYWARSSSSFGACTINSGTASLTNASGNTITITAAATNGLGITFTPASSSSIYLITASFGLFCGSTDNASLRFNDGTNSFGGITFGSTVAAAVTSPTTLTSIYAPGTASAVTVLIQALTGSASKLQIYGDDAGTASQGVQWTVIQLV